MADRPRSLVLVLLFLIALVPRIFFLDEARRHPLFERPYLDAKSYDTWAQELSGGSWMGERAFHMAPLYPYMLGGFYKLFGDSALGVRIAHHLLGAASLLLLYLIARRLFGGRAAVVAYLLGLGYAPFLYFEGQILASAAGVAFGLLALHLLIRALARDGHGLFWAGLALCAGSVARPNLLFFMPLAILWILLIEKGLRRKAVPYLIGFAIALIPPVLHNFIVSKEFIPISTHGGVSFYLGNNEFTNGTYVPPPEFGGTPEAIDIYDSKRIAEADLGRSLGPTEISSYWYGKSFRFIREEPGRFIRLIGRKAALYFNAFEIPLDYNYDYDRRIYRTLRLAPVSFGVLLSLGLVGLFLVPRPGRRGYLPALFIAANAVSVIAFFVCARYRQTAVPALAILAALTLVTLAEHLIGRRWRCAAMIGAATLLIAITIHLDLYPGVTTGAARSAVIVGRAWTDAGETELAADAYREALEMVPSYVDGWMNLGMLRYRTGSFGEAAAAFEEATKNAPHFAGAWNNLGNARREAGNREGAVAAIEEALRIDPDYIGAWNNLGFTLAAAGRYDEAVAAYERGIAADRRSVQVWANLADLFVERGDFPGAMGVFGRALDAMPGDKRILWKREQVDRAARAYHQAGLSLGRGDRLGAERYIRESVDSGGEPIRRLIERHESLAPLLGEGS